MSFKFDLKLLRNSIEFNYSGQFDLGITGILGSSGSGKTTFFNLISGLQKADEGFICLNKRLLTDTYKNIQIPIHRRRVGYVFQDNLLFPHKTIEENLLFGRPYAKKNRVNFEEIVDLLNLSSILSSKPHEISGGEGQRTAIGRAILSSPDILLLDEPFNAVDYTLRSEILTYIKTLNKKLKIPILVISHDYSDLKMLTDRFYIIERGQKSSLKVDVS